MNTSTKLLIQFIDDYALRTDGIISFEARIVIVQHGHAVALMSGVQVLNLPGKMVLYIIEQVDNRFNLPEMYTTENHTFTYERHGILKVTDPTAALHVSIMPTL